MKKIFFIVLGGYFVVGMALLFLSDPTPDVIHILSIERPFALFVTDPEEKMSFQLFVDDNDCFLVDPKQIRAARLTDGSSELALSPMAIVAEDTTMEHNGVFYQSFRYEFGFDTVSMTEGVLVFTDAALEVTFENGYVAAYGIGDVEIIFGQPGEPRHLDFWRLYGVFNVQDGVEAIAGIGSGREA
ncbi:MAG: hypothetical protein V1761_04105 [bacterium]